MLVVHVYIEVKPNRIKDFIEASIMNARESLKEPGIARFDLLQDRENPCKFVLNEVYRTNEAPASHKQTSHYNHWKDAVADMLAGPRTKQVYGSVFPLDESWD
jgi:(4S)-4-hydroxy-5-phosphonooxypentane-2,3-dione isomerase